MTDDCRKASERQNGTGDVPCAVVREKGRKLRLVFGFRSCVFVAGKHHKNSSQGTKHRKVNEHGRIAAGPEQDRAGNKRTADAADDATDAVCDINGCFSGQTVIKI